MSTKRTASLIRKEFLDYFQNNGHSFIRSSPIVPLNDPTVAFINAGMNQFKGVFLDYYKPPVTRVVNSQKCIRVGGKHNDLSIVGGDGYHHTFFEMLGNWSFGDYFKEDACRYAWDLLTNGYGIKKDFLYVTYFAGDEKLGLQPDLECKDIWLSIGIPKDKVLPFGLQDNFWEMGLSGPCGPCTEIHVDHTKQMTNRSLQINKGFANLTELWNIVFIQCERLTNGSIIPLSKHHVDTGMGLERLVALLQEKESNYDTDLFQPLFHAIQKCSKAPEYKGRFGNEDKDGLDTGYRILADHSRMISVALADGMLTQENHKLRRIIRKAIDVGEKVFKKNGILSELAYIVSDNLGDFYPELRTNLKQVQRIMQFEEDLYRNLQNTSGKDWKKLVDLRPELAHVTEWTLPGLVKGYQYLHSTLKDLQNTKVLPRDVAYKLYDTYGLNSETISELATIESLHFDETVLKDALKNAAYRFKIGLEKKHEIDLNNLACLLEKNNVPKTDDSFKYRYTFNENYYTFPTIDSKIVGLIINDEVILNNKKEGEIDTRKNVYASLKSNKENCFGILLDKTLCYSLEGGQISDEGCIHVNDLVFNVNTVRKVNDYVVHFGKFAGDIKNIDKIQIGDHCTVAVNHELRTGAMKQHTATHLLTASLKKFLQAIYFRNYFAHRHFFKLSFHSFGEKLSLEQLKQIENLINDVITANIPISTKVLNSLELLKEDFVTFLPGNIYPYTNIRLVEMIADDLMSKEACCGTHVHNTGVLEHFCFLKYASKGPNHSITAVVGPTAVSFKQAGNDFYRKIQNIESKLNAEKFSYSATESMIDEIISQINNDNTEIPYVLKEEYILKLEDLRKSAWRKAKEMEKFLISTQMQDVVNARCPSIVYCLRQHLEHLSLHELISLYPEKPVLLILQDKDTVRARCSIPQEMISEKFNAKIWMKIVLEIFNAKYGSVDGFNPLLVACMKSKTVSGSLDALIQKAMTETENFAAMNIKQLKVSNTCN